MNETLKVKMEKTDVSREDLDAVRQHGNGGRLEEEDGQEGKGKNRMPRQLRR